MLMSQNLYIQHVIMSHLHVISHNLVSNAVYQVAVTAAAKT